MTTRIQNRLIQPGWFLTLTDERRGEEKEPYFVENAEFATVVHTLGDGISSNAPVAAGATVEGEPIKVLECVSRDALYQVFLGIDVNDVLCFVRSPISVYQHGIAQRPKQTSSNRYIGELDGNITPFEDPSPRTEFFTRTASETPYPELDFVSVSRFSRTPRIRFYVQKLKLAPVEDPNVRARIASFAQAHRPLVLGGLNEHGGVPSGGGG